MMFTIHNADGSRIVVRTLDDASEKLKVVHVPRGMALTLNMGTLYKPEQVLGAIPRCELPRFRRALEEEASVDVTDQLAGAIVQAAQFDHAGTREILASAARACNQAIAAKAVLDAIDAQALVDESELDAADRQAA